MFTIYRKGKAIARVEITNDIVIVASNTQLIHNILKNILSRPHFVRDRKGHRVHTDNKEVIVEDILRTKVFSPFRVEKEDALKGSTKYYNKVPLYNVK